MAVQHITVLTDDLDGTEAKQSIKFSVNGSNYEIDLSDSNAAKMQKAMEKYVEAARRIPKTRRRRVPSS